MSTIIGITIIIFSLIALYVAGNAEGETWGDVLLFFSTILFVVGTIIIHVGKLSAMDVYRGKTTLQITYKNNVPIDSTVVYK